MKKIFKVLCLASCLAAVACEDNFKELDKGNDVLTLTGPTSEIVLNEANHAADAVSLSWTTGSNYGTGNKISYSLKFNANGNTVSKDLGTGVYSWKMTVEELNNYLINDFGAAYNENVTVGVELTASVYGHDELEQKSAAAFNVTTYEPVTKTLYIIGDAAKNGWSLDSAEELTRTDNGQFTLITRLLGGKDFKFIVSREGFEPGYNRAGTDNSKLVYRATGSDPDEKFQVPEDGNYELKLNLLDLTISIEASSGPTERCEEMFFVGSFNGWGFTPMDHDPIAMNMWFYGSMFNSGNGGEFKFGTQSGNYDSATMFMATQGGAPYTSQGVVLGGDDNKWFLNDDEQDKAYKIYLDVTPGKERMIMNEFTGVEGVWMVGDATPNGWDLGNATPLTAGDNFTYTWSGNLNTGEIKFSCDKKDDWMGKWFMAARNGENPTGEEEFMLFLDKSDTFYSELYPEIGVGDLDSKWKIAEAGAYEITMNVLTHKVTFKKQ